MYEKYISLPFPDYQEFMLDDNDWSKTIADTSTNSNVLIPLEWYYEKYPPEDIEDILC